MKRSSRPPSLDDTETLREFVQHVRVGMYITTPEGAYIDANAALVEIFGVESVDALKERRVDEFLTDPSQRPRVLEAVDREGHALEVEVELRRADGDIRTVLETTYARRRDCPGRRCPAAAPDPPRARPSSRRSAWLTSRQDSRCLR